MPLFSKLRADNHYAKGTSILQMLPQIDEPDKAKDSLRQAIDSLLKATDLQPEFGHAWHNLGIAYYYGGEFLDQVTDAVRRSDRLIEHAETFQTNSEGSYQNSLRALERALKFMPGSPEVHNNRGRTLAKLYRTDEAIEEFDIALELDPSYIKAAENRAILERKVDP